MAMSLYLFVLPLWNVPFPIPTHAVRPTTPCAVSALNQTPRSPHLKPALVLTAYLGK